MKREWFVIIDAEGEFKGRLFTTAEAAMDDYGTRNGGWVFPYIAPKKGVECWRLSVEFHERVYPPTERGDHATP